MRNFLFNRVRQQLVGNNLFPLSYLEMEGLLFLNLLGRILPLLLLLLLTRILYVYRRCAFFVYTRISVSVRGGCGEVVEAVYL